MYGLQNSLDSKLQSVCSKLEVVCDRMAKLEERQQSLEEKLPSNNKTPASTPDGNSLDKRRKRHTPCDLQVRSIQCREGSIGNTLPPPPPPHQIAFEW